ncbi:MAG: hypothetical protein OXI54_13080 [Chloroflexota bacterium]|nr:hypothetical protein [Chloroflexota bacterium]MDE2685063.1 hypothetical protein [Chloroflexota bacterium]
MKFTDDDRASWAFVEGSISVSASILIAYAIAKCAGCAGLPVIGFFKNLTEQDNGVIITGMALLFPTAFAFYVGVKMVFAAYRDYKRWRDDWLKRARTEGRTEGRQEGRESERERIRKELDQQGILTPEAERILSDESERHTD